MSKLTDYGTLVLARLARADGVTTTASMATTTGLPLSTVRKVLKALAGAGLVTSERGAAGGYQLARPATRISAADILAALEGPVQLTECTVAGHDCQIEANCSVGSGWQRINAGILKALAAVSLDDLVRDTAFTPRFEQRLKPLIEITGASHRSDL